MSENALPEHITDDSSPAPHPGLHAIALVEMTKGALALLAASGLEILGPAPLQEALRALIRHFQLDPDGGVTGWLSHAINPTGIHITAAIAALYGVMHLLEGWGLWRAKAWASWFGCLSAAAYLPFDVTAFVHHRHWLEAAAVAINLLVVWVLARDLLKRRQTH
ncbi:DUF2127 domain-containing protein [Lysobacter pythonis]|uniref:DUF2127 domain-containing protein n=1 Tax=Solilutibacter pythonis TaxID=2483112 RepID=A0A3M2HUR3_9GAMM|nr:DUF2127 domain-containing protein [Lysobacter pythonis]RMH89534.1 DUF2127 domain-containing protein [Lysobacter pythonis]